ncbi:MAG: alpha/beta fold hydrolase [Nocardioides sp.]
MTRTRLVDTRAPRDPEGVVLVLHGGAAREGGLAVSPTQLSVLRMVPLARRIARGGGGRLAVVRLLNSTRGWRDEHTPVDDAVWAMEQVRERYGDLPVSLVGHSLGGRAALLAGEQAGVVSVVALNPWVYPDESGDLSGRQVLIVHGTADRVALPERSAAVARRLALTTDVGYITIPDAKHAMLRHGRRFETYASEFVCATLLGRDGLRLSEPVAAVLDGDRFVAG